MSHYSFISFTYASNSASKSSTVGVTCGCRPFARPPLSRTPPFRLLFCCAPEIYGYVFVKMLSSFKEIRDEREFN